MCHRLCHSALLGEILVKLYMILKRLGGPLELAPRPEARIRRPLLDDLLLVHRTRPRVRHGECATTFADTTLPKDTQHYNGKALTRCTVAPKMRPVGSLWVSPALRG